MIRVSDMQAKACPAGSGMPPMRKSGSPGTATRPSAHCGVGPSPGRAASSGKAGTWPSETTDGDTTVPVPTANPGPRRYAAPSSTALGTTENVATAYIT